MKISLEIRPGEGGEDAKLLVSDQATIYCKFAERVKAHVEVEEDHGWINLTVDGPENIVKRLLQESGGHRWQRIPPTERKGRIHTSTVTVVAMEIPAEREWKLVERDIEIFTKRASGAGGQHVNTTDSCVVMRHLPTGIESKASTRCQHDNRRTAREMLECRVKSYYDDQKNSAMNKQRAEDRGSGMRGDKIRTYRDRDSIVTDHRSDVKMRLKDVKAGKLEPLWLN